MEVIRNIGRGYQSTSTVLTLGTFDGIHLGHQEIIKEVKQRALAKGLVSALITFEPHPQIVLGKKDRPPVKILTTIEEKVGLLASSSLDQVIVIDFTPELAQTEPEEFVQEILLEKLNMKELIIGYDHAFGKDRKGNYELLKRMSEKYHFRIDVIPPILKGDSIISSTRIRKLLLDGDVQTAAIMLGRHYSIRGRVVPGHGRGRSIGFPTANIQPLSPHKLIPKAGIYATRIRVKDRVYDSVSYIGSRPTFNLAEKVIEVHISDFSGELYGEDVELFMIHFLRNDVRFESTERLIVQIKEDKEKSLELLQKK